MARTPGPDNVLCAWCGAGLGYEPALAPGAESTGICGDCALKYFGIDVTEEVAT